MLVTQNILLNLLPAEDIALLSPSLEQVVLRQNDVLFEPYRPLLHVHFLESGLSSEIVTNEDGKRIEVGCVGFEGFTAVPVVLGVYRTPHMGFMQAGGTALRIGTEELWQAMSRSENLRSILTRYAHVFMMQMAASAMANGQYQIDARLARWLLMSADRLGTQLPLTHESLSLMLGVRRPSVTDALHVLEGERIIEASRGMIKVRDREKLKKVAGNAYGLSESEYQNLISRSWPKDEVS